MKICCTCKNKKKLTEFNNNRSRRDGLQGHCRECQKEKSKAFYKDNKVTQRASIKARNKRVSIENRLFTYNYLLNNPCVHCGEDDPVVLEFDHIKGKKYSVCAIAGSSYSLDTVKKEIEKCQVLCCNCHRRKTSKDLGHYKYLEA